MMIFSRKKDTDFYDDHIGGALDDISHNDDVNDEDGDDDDGDDNCYEQGAILTNVQVETYVQVFILTQYKLYRI